MKSNEPATVPLSRLIGSLLYLPLFPVILFFLAGEWHWIEGWVKIQKERGQKVISTGLYSIVRHPMYAGATLLFISSPLLLSSVYGLALGFVLIVIIAVRSVGEESMLKQELEGYREYMQKVRWRMIPFVF